MTWTWAADGGRFEPCKTPWYLWFWPYCLRCGWHRQFHPPYSLTNPNRKDHMSEPLRLTFPSEADAARPHEHESIEVLELGAALNIALKTAEHGSAAIPRAEIAKKVEAVLRRFGYQARVIE